MITDSEQSRMAVEQLDAEAPAIETPIIEVIASQSFSSSDEDGYEGRYDTVVIRVGKMTDDELEEEVLDRYPPEHCQHEYDCCAHWYQNRPRIERHGAIAIITLGYTQNI